MNQEATNSPTEMTSNSSPRDSELFQKPDLPKLNKYYTDADTADKPIFAEMRSSLLLVAGEHYMNRESKFYQRIRNSTDISREQKIRLTKNHTRKITQLISNAILGTNPSVGFEAKDESSTQSQKAAELDHSAWEDAVCKYDLDNEKDEWCDSFVQIGEVHVKIFWDPNAGKVVGYEQQADEAGNLAHDEMGQPIADENRPVAEGQFCFEEIYGFNLLRPPECKDLKKAEWLGVRKMVERGELMRKFPDLPSSAFGTSSDDTYLIFDITRGGYQKSDNQVMVREYYFRPSLKYPNGYFFITTKEAILAEGELPGGIFPIKTQLFDKIKTTARGRSPVKTMRPYQAEINRCASKIAEHQITAGDDKIIIQNGNKSSAYLPGVRTMNVTGQSLEVLQGRDGGQFVQTMQNTISELYQVMMVPEINEDKESAADPFTLLFRSAREKKRFQRYVKKFEAFLLDVAKTYLALAKIHLPDNALIQAIGKTEQVNMQEFRNNSDGNYNTKIVPQSDDVETKFGKQMVANHIIQYAGSNLDKDSIGKIIRSMPYANNEEQFDELTIKYDMVTNDILALDRGEQPPIVEGTDHAYHIGRLSFRMSKADFRFLPPNVQQNYAMKLQQHQQLQAEALAAQQRAEQGFIPTDGELIPIDFYVNAPDSRGGVKQVKAKVPYSSVHWLLKQLEAQGSQAQMLENLPEDSKTAILSQMPAPPPQMGGAAMQPVTGTTQQQLQPAQMQGG